MKKAITLILALVMVICCTAALAEETEEATFQQQLQWIFFFKDPAILLSIGVYAHAHHLAALTTLHEGYGAADRRNELHFGMVLVNKQGIPDLDNVTLFDNDLGFHTIEVIRNQRKLALHLRLDGFQARFAL